MINTIRQNLNQVVVEAAQLKRQLLMLQIENLENELLPCEESLAGCLAAIHQGKEIPNQLMLRKAAATAAQLRRLQQELHHTEHLLALAGCSH